MSATQEAERPIKGIECKHAVLVPHENGRDDIHFVKEVVHYEDGGYAPRTRKIKNFQRPYWTTKKAYRDHEQKKEFEHLDRLDRHECTQTELAHRVSMTLHGRPPTGWGSVRELAASPYLYGTDMLSTTYLKYLYAEKYGQLVSRNTVAVMDTETDVVTGTGDVNIISITFGKRVYTAVVKSFLQGYANAEEQLRDAFKRYLGEVSMMVKVPGEKKKKLAIVDIVKERGIEWELEIVNDPMEAIIGAFKRAHEWQPDLLAFWHMDHDISEILRMCKKYEYSPADLFSDPSLPPSMRWFKYNRGADKRITASGVLKTIQPAENWHTVVAPASFYCVDGMCVYLALRVQGEGKDPSYSLNAILDKVLGARKLSFTETDNFSGIRWHIVMQRDHPIKYVIYNVFDCIGIELLDEETLDLQFAFTVQCGYSDFSLFRSQPRLLADDITFFIKKDNLVWGTTAPKMFTDIDEETIGADGWISTLPAHSVDDNGLKCIKEYPDLRTNIRLHLGD